MTGPLHILVVGGNGFLGSAVCRAALAHGMQVTSVSSSGRPYRTLKGHTPAWVHKVNWQQGDAFNPESFSHLFPKSYAVVHTLGTLFEGTGVDGKSYKTALRESDLGHIFRTLTSRLALSNPLKPSDPTKSYEAVNRDSALRVLDAYLTSSSPTPDLPRPFVYISAEDIFRPFVPEGYIVTKRQAELGISQRVAGREKEYKPVYVRPGLVYHAHQRPLTTLPATLLDLSASFHRRVPHSFPTPAGFFRSLDRQAEGSSDALPESSSFGAIANALTTRPLHVDQVAQVILKALSPQRTDLRGVLGVSEMVKLLWDKEDITQSSSRVTV